MGINDARSKMTQNQMDLEIKTSKSINNNPSEGFSAFGLAIARVTHIYWEEMRCSIECVYGEADRAPHHGVEITQSSIGARHFLGAIPNVGDFCIVGWFGANTTGKAGKKSPAILSWMPRPTYFGHDWLPVQDYGHQEGVMNSPSQRKEIESYANRIRFKMRHYEPGNIGASSSQGSDLVLDESVLLSNRRMNEILIRDQDQAIVMRSLQQFHAMAGARLYSGLVQRDAQYIPKEMVYDDTDWSMENIETLNEGSFSENADQETENIGKLLPHKLFLRRSNGKSDFENQGGIIDDYLNPYTFYENAGLIDSNSFVTVSENDEGFLYGGKSILRINDNGENTNSEALTEYRVELNHTSTGTLPVTEQTDGFDSDKQEDKTRYLEFVLGSVVGNDPFGDESNLYGLPLKAVVDENGSRLEPETQEIGDQSATLFRINPVGVGSQAPSFTSFKKDGSFVASIGSPNSNAVNVNVEGGVNLTSNVITEISSPKISLQGGLNDGEGVEINGSSGLVLIKSEGSQSLNETSEGLPSNLKKTSISLQASKSISLQSSTAIVMDAPVVDYSNVKSFNFSAQDDMALKGGRQVKIDTEKYIVNSSGPKSEMIIGPSQGIPINDQGESKTIACSPATGSVGGIVKNTVIVAGDELKATIGAGNNTTLMSAGVHSTAVGTGAISSTVGANNTLLSPAGVLQTISTGNSLVTTPTGAHVVNSTVAIGLRSVGVANVSGSALILEGVSSPTVVGPVMCGSDIHPLIGLPYVALGMLPRTQSLAPKLA